MINTILWVVLLALCIHVGVWVVLLRGDAFAFPWMECDEQDYNHLAQMIGKYSHLDTELAKLNEQDWISKYQYARVLKKYHNALDRSRKHQEFHRKIQSKVGFYNKANKIKVEK